MQIQISVRQKPIVIDRRRLRKSAKSILSALGYTEVELSIAIVDNVEMARLNQGYRGVEGATDVLAFAMRDGEYGEVCSELLGDVVISAPTAQAMAVEHQCPMEAIWDLLLTHGVLHLVGYDHERSPSDARDMDDQTLKLLELLGYSPDVFAWYQTTRPSAP
ncbi:MAG TPA: rRNA maturation RNase YbeY [Syntrophobacteraceae bacterium]|nr:rRNA maturation RNase YbeY [Syntrophobacteraceae bacterium]